MLPIARTDHVQVCHEEDRVIVSVPELDESFCLAPITARVWHLSDGRTTVPEIVRRTSEELGIEPEPETIWAVLDCLADAGLLAVRMTPPVAYRCDLMRRLSFSAGLASTTFPIDDPRTSSPMRANNGEQQGKREEEGRKQEEGQKEGNNKYMERQAKQQEEHQKQVERNQKQEQTNKEQMNKEQARK